MNSKAVNTIFYGSSPHQLQCFFDYYLEFGDLGQFGVWNIVVVFTFRVRMYG